jgi:hypothetical protein
MASTKKPSPVFEVVFTGGGVYPEKIPIGKVTDTLSAVRRLATGEMVGDEDEEEEEEETEADRSIRLLDVTRTSSAVFRFVGPSPAVAIQRLKATGRILENPEDVGQYEYILRPVKDLSKIAETLNCSVILREAGRRHEVLARIEPTSYSKISRSLLISGSTQISGTVQRVGGATAMRCALRVSFQSRLLFCRVEADSVARKLGDALYQRVIAAGTARWLRISMRIFSFTVQDVTRPKEGSIEDHLKAIWEAGVKDWEKLDDPDGFLQEVRSCE